MKTVFLRAIEATDKEKCLRQIVGLQRPDRNTRFLVDSAAFRDVPGTPFAYWVGECLRETFTQFDAFESDGRCARQGGVPGENFRRLRLQWEVYHRDKTRWRCYAKGGAFSRFYADTHLLIGWDFERSSFHAFTGLPHRPSLQPASCGYYFRPGLTWPRRTTSGISVRALPAGSIFADKGPTAFVAADDASELSALAAVLNSAPFATLVSLQLAAADAAARSYEVGVIQRTPIPPLGKEDQSALAALAGRAWSIKRSLDTRTENSHAFALPGLLQVEGTDLRARFDAWCEHERGVEAELASIQALIDDRCFQLYGIGKADRRTIAERFGRADSEEDAPDKRKASEDAREAEEETAEARVPTSYVTEVLSWVVGVAFGRFDVRLATRDRAMPPEPEPFDPLPVCSPGMLSCADGLPVDSPPDHYPIRFSHTGVLVDDSGHPWDVVGRSQEVLSVVFGTESDTHWQVAASILDEQTRDLRRWFAREFFGLHIKMYSRSRRKAPIYWQLATPSASYSIWLYYHRFTKDTLFRVHNEFVDPKMKFEEGKLARLQQEFGPEQSAGQRKELEAQETFVEELRGFRQELGRVAPLWNPDLNDGVIINFAPLWRLVPQHRQWQQECKSCWDKLVAGEYDWAHLAMHLWPERVVPKCIDDRSLAIAHGLEDAFWVEGEDGKWKQRMVEQATADRLIHERSSTGVKAALDDLLSAPAPAAGGKRGTRGSKGKAAAQKQRATLFREDTKVKTPPVPAVDENVLDAVRNAIGQVAGGASRADVQASIGLTEVEWNSAIAVLLERGDVTRTGEKRGTRYHSSKTIGGNNA